jgi:hypothetical protein
MMGGPIGHEDPDPGILGARSRSRAKQLAGGRVRVISATQIEIVIVDDPVTEVRLEEDLEVVSRGAMLNQKGCSSS